MAIRPTPPPDSSGIVRRLAPWRRNCLRYAFYPFGDDWRLVDPDGREVSVRVSGHLVTNSAETLRAMALAGQGAFLAPTFVAGEDLASGRLVRILPSYVGIELTVNAIYPHRHHLSSKVRRFLDLVAERFASHRHWAELG